MEHAFQKEKAAIVKNKMENIARHHIHKRKEIHTKNQNPKKFKKTIDYLIYAVAILAPIMTIPQVLKIWVYQNASGISLISWTSYLIFAFVWLSYGIVHKEKPIIITNILWIIMKIFVVIGTIKYG